MQSDLEMKIIVIFHGKEMDVWVLVIEEKNSHSFSCLFYDELKYRIIHIFFWHNSMHVKSCRRYIL